MFDEDEDDDIVRYLKIAGCSIYRIIAALNQNSFYFAQERKNQDSP
jgi:hypothetical protein